MLVRASMLGFAMSFVGCLGGGPVFSSTDEALFASPPVVVERRGHYVIRWTQGSYPFFFQPDFDVIEGRLVVSVRGSSSSGMLAGRPREVVIDEPRAAAAVTRASIGASGAGVYFWEPEPRPRGRLVPLVIRHEP